jgi:hypothetical protein
MIRRKIRILFRTMNQRTSARQALGSRRHHGLLGRHAQDETVDYAILLDGERTLVLDDGEVQWQPGDIVIESAPGISGKAMARKAAASCMT